MSGRLTYLACIWAVCVFALLFIRLDLRETLIVLTADLILAGFCIAVQFYKQWKPTSTTINLQLPEASAEAIRSEMQKQQPGKVVRLPEHLK